MCRKGEARGTRRFWRALPPGEPEQEIDEEIAHHLAMRMAENEAAGMSPEAARAEALRRFGNVTVIRERTARMDRVLARRSRWSARADRFRRSMLLAMRSFRRTPGLAISIVAILALGLGAATTVFTTLEGPMLRPLPYPDESRLVRLVHRGPGLPAGEGLGTSTAAYAVFAEHQQSFTDIGLYVWGVQTLNGGQAVRVTMGVSTSNLPAILGVSPVLGRPFSPKDPTGALGDEIMISHAFWMTHFGGDSTAIDRLVDMGGDQVRIVGVLSPDESRVNVYLQVDVWRAMNAYEALPETWHSAWAIGRLRKGVDRSAAEGDLRRLIVRLPESRPDIFPADWPSRYTATLLPLREGPSGAFWSIFGCVLVLLFVCCGNVANLLLARRESRRHETAIRAAIGGSRWDLLSDDIAEAIVLVAVAVAVSLVIARVSVPLLVDWAAPTKPPRWDTIEFGVPTFVFAFISAAATAVMVTVIGSFRRGHGAAMLRDAWRGAAITRPAPVLHFALAAGQVALALIAANGAGLALRTVQNILAVDPGVRTDGVLTFEIHLPPSYETPADVANFHRTLSADLESLPSVRSAGAATMLPLAGTVPGMCTPLHATGVEAMDGSQCVLVGTAAPGFAETLGMRVRGSTLTWQEPGTAIVTARLAERLWPGAEAIGKSFRVGESEASYRIVGVLENLRPYIYQPPVEGAYMSVVGPAGAPRRLTYAVVVLRTDAAQPLLVMPDVRRVLSRLDASIAISNVRTMDDVALAVTRRFTFMLSVLGFAAVACLLLSAIGVFGVVNHVAGRRTREIGIRIALGAAVANIGRTMAGRAYRFTAIGVLVGLVVSLAATRLLATMLFGVKPVDAPVYVAVTVLVCATSIVAGWIPARRAARLHPMDALRSD